MDIIKTTSKVKSGKIKTQISHTQATKRICKLNREIGFQHILSHH